MKGMTFKRERQTAAEAEAAELSQLGNDLLEQTYGADPTTIEALRTEVIRLFAVAHAITAALARGEIDTAYRLSIGGDVDGTSLGTTA